MFDFKLPRNELVTPNQQQPTIKERKINCYCCYDGGLIPSRLVKLVVPDYNEQKDKQPICQRIQCGKSSKFISLLEMQVLDTRFSHDICQKIHDFEKAEMSNAKNTKPTNLNINSLTEKMKMPKASGQTLKDALEWERTGKGKGYQND